MGRPTRDRQRFVPERPAGDRSVRSVALARAGVRRGRIALMKLPRLRVSLRGALVLLSIAAILCAYGGYRLRKAMRQQEAVAYIESQGGLVLYSDQSVNVRIGETVPLIGETVPLSEHFWRN